MKYAIPVACFVFALVGLGLGVSSSRGGKLAAFALGSGVVFVYYIIMFQTRSLAMGNQIPGGLAAWLPNILLGPAGAVILLRKARSSGRSFQFSVPAVGVLKRFLPARLRRRDDGRRLPRAARWWSSGFPSSGCPRLGVLDAYIARQFVRLQVLTFASLLGIFYISTFIDLSDKLFRGSATVELDGADVRLPDAGVRALHPAALGPHRDAGHRGRDDAQQRADRDARVRHQPVPGGGAPPRPGGRLERASVRDRRVRARAVEPAGATTWNTRSGTAGRAS